VAMAAARLEVAQETATAMAGVREAPREVVSAVVLDVA
jgi:hypothetical protein